MNFFCCKLFVKYCLIVITVYGNKQVKKKQFSLLRMTNMEYMLYKSMRESVQNSTVRRKVFAWLTAFVFFRSLSPASDWLIHFLYKILGVLCLPEDKKICLNMLRARIFKRLWSSGIDSKESILPGYIAWRAGTSNVKPTLFQDRLLPFSY
jgi:hypothetical protein